MLRLQSVRRGNSDGDHGPAFITEGTPQSGEFIIRLGPASGSGDDRDGSVATLQFEALAAGSVTIGIADLVITDPAGAVIPSEASRLTAEAEVLSGAL